MKQKNGLASWKTKHGITQTEQQKEKKLRQLKGPTGQHQAE